MTLHPAGRSLSLSGRDALTVGGAVIAAAGAPAAADRPVADLATFEAWEPAVVSWVGVDTRIGPRYSERAMISFMISFVPPKIRWTRASTKAWAIG